MSSPQDTQVRRLLIYRCGQIGDAVAALPSLWMLRETFPNAEFTLLSEVPTKQIHLPPENVFPPEVLVQRYVKYQTGRSIIGLVSVVRTLLRLRLRRFDAVAYLLPSIRTPTQRRRDEGFFRLAGIRILWGFKGFCDDPYPRREDGALATVPHEADALLHRLALDGFPKVAEGQGKMDLRLTDTEKQHADAWWLENCPSEYRDKPFFALCFGSKWISKQWPVEHFESVVSQIISHLNITPVIIGGPEDRQQGMKLIRKWGIGVCAAGSLPVRVSAALMRRSRFYLGNDTGVLHLAAAQGISCVSPFSAQDWPGRWHPYGNNHVVLREEVTCAGCRIGNCPYDRRCLRQIGVGRVFDICRKVVECRSSESEKELSNPIQENSSGSSRSQKVVVLTQLTSPYQVELFNALATHCSFHLEVIYLTDQDSSRDWIPAPINHTHLVISRMPHMKKGALDSIRSADLAIFNFYTDAFALQAIRIRSRTRKPWVFWGERPGFFRTGVGGRLARQILLQPLHRYPVSIWAIGLFAREGYEREFGRSRRYRNVPYASDLSRFLNLPIQSPTCRKIVFSGSLIHRKGVDLLAKAFSRIAVDDPSVSLVVMGTGPLEAEMKRLLKGCKNQVEWKGQVAWSDVHQVYSEGSIFCFPSRYDGWGLALVEAMASGMIPISTDQTGAAIDLIGEQSASCGYLIPNNDEEALFNALKQALALPPDRKSAMQLESRRRAEALHLPASVERFNEAVKEVLDHWHARSLVD